MSYIRIETTAKLAAKQFENLRKAIPVVSKQRFYEAMQLIRKRLQVPGKRVTYPIDWDTLRQMRAFFASDGFGGGIPHIRTGATAAGFTISKLPQGFEINNLKRGAVHVFGNALRQRQSRIHRRNWTKFRDIVDAVVKKLPKSIIATLTLKSRPRR